VAASSYLLALKREVASSLVLVKTLIFFNTFYIEALSGSSSKAFLRIYSPAASFPE
jgi:hypothetical protein